MSNKDQARRTAVEIAFDGIDISSSIRPYLLSVSYTDNEEDETDDLQIQLHDREGIWLCQWLNDAIDAAASTTSASTGSGTGQYQVTAKAGLNVRSRPGTSYKKIGALVYGAPVEVLSIENGWAKLKHNGKTAYASASYLSQSGAGTSSTGLTVQAVILRKNWKGDGNDAVLDCGQFELDSVDASGPPSTITIKTTSLPYSSQIRQTKHSKAWESYSLSGIANEIAHVNGMVCLFESSYDPFYARMEQYQASDIEFLSGLCHDAGISLKATNNILVLFDQETYEAKEPVLTFRRGGGAYVSYKLSSGKADKQYSSCRVSYTDPATKKCIEATAYIADYKKDDKNNQQLEITAKVSSVSEAKTLAEKRLRLQNKYERTATFTLPGNPGLVAGVTVMLAGWGAWDGKYMIAQSKHTVNGSGYTVQIKLRRILEGY